MSAPLASGESPGTRARTNSFYIQLRKFDLPAEFIAADQETRDEMLWTIKPTARNEGVTSARAAVCLHSEPNPETGAREPPSGMKTAAQTLLYGY